MECIVTHSISGMDLEGGVMVMWQMWGMRIISMKITRRVRRGRGNLWLRIIMCNGRWRRWGGETKSQIPGKCSYECCWNFVFLLYCTTDHRSFIGSSSSYQNFNLTKVVWADWGLGRSSVERLITWWSGSEFGHKEKIKNGCKVYEFTGVRMRLERINGHSFCSARKHRRWDI